MELTSKTIGSYQTHLKAEQLVFRAQVRRWGIIITLNLISVTCLILTGVLIGLNLVG